MNIIIFVLIIYDFILWSLECHYSNIFFNIDYGFFHLLYNTISIIQLVFFDFYCSDTDKLADMKIIFHFWVIVQPPNRSRLRTYIILN
jgi:hypothetical protein